MSVGLKLMKCFEMGGKVSLPSINSALSYAESGLSDGGFFRAPSKVSTTALVLA